MGWITPCVSICLVCCVCCVCVRVRCLRVKCHRPPDCYGDAMRRRLCVCCECCAYVCVYVCYVREPPAPGPLRAAYASNASLSSPSSLSSYPLCLLSYPLCLLSYPLSLSTHGLISLSTLTDEPGLVSKRYPTTAVTPVKRVRLLPWGSRLETCLLR